MNTVWYDVYNGEIKVNALIRIIECNKYMIANGYIKSFVIIYLPDGRNIKGVYLSNSKSWSMEWVLDVPNKNDKLYGIVRTSKVKYPIHAVDKHGNTVLEFRGDDRRECIKNSLQTFLLDNKYKIAVI